MKIQHHVPVIVILIAAILLPGKVTANDTGIWQAVCWRLLDQDKYISSANPEDLPWREIRRQRKLRSTANRDPKRFTLEMLSGQDNPNAVFLPFGKVMSATASTFFRDPDGVVHSLEDVTGGEDIISLPPDENLIGRYLLGAHAILENMDPDGEGSRETVHLCAKHLITHYKAGGNMGSVSVVFFDAPSRMPLEIGPVINTAKSRYGGGIQRTHRSYEMMVKFKGVPLSGAQVTILAEGAGWRRATLTDENGIFETIPTDDRTLAADWQRYLYIAHHRDPASGEIYVSTLPTVIYKNRPEWRSKTVGFVFWAIIGCGLCLLGIWGHVRRKRWQETRQMAVFKNHKTEI